MLHERVFYRSLRRAGEAVLALDVLYGLDTGIRLNRLQWAADELATSWICRSHR